MAPTTSGSTPTAPPPKTSPDSFNTTRLNKGHHQPFTASRETLCQRGGRDITTSPLALCRLPAAPIFLAESGALAPPPTAENQAWPTSKRTNLVTSSPASLSTCATVFF